MPDLFEIDSVIKTFGVNQVLTDIYLKCETGDILGLLGRNGSGKTTFLRILFGTMPAERNFIRINGTMNNFPYKTKNEFCYLPQHGFLPGHLHVGKVVELYLGKASIETFLRGTILAHLRKNRVSDLSGGELRYLEIKLLLSTDSKFILLDEPFTGISPILVQTIKALILEASKTKGIILTDHDYRNVFDVANRYCLIYDGGLKERMDKTELVRWGYVSGSNI
ncbi:MAG: ATP-binding cassette domain-containing protein [Bacteroidales bacterium]|nr:ATP-binding cassette domain-containing protein [Bacteroidales bacterium]